MHNYVINNYTITCLYHESQIKLFLNSYSLLQPCNATFVVSISTCFLLLQCGISVIGIVLVAGVINPWVFIPTAPLIIIFILYRRFYLRTSREVKRLEGASKHVIALQSSQEHRAAKLRADSSMCLETDFHQRHLRICFNILFLNFASIVTSIWIAMEL